MSEFIHGFKDGFTFYGVGFCVAVNIIFFLINLLFTLIVVSLGLKKK